MSTGVSDLSENVASVGNRRRGRHRLGGCRDDILSQSAARRQGQEVSQLAEHNIKQHAEHGFLFSVRAFPLVHTVRLGARNPSRPRDWNQRCQ